MIVFTWLYLKFQYKSEHREAESKWVTVCIWGRGKGGSCLMGADFFCGDENALKSEVMATQHCKCTKSHKPYTLKWLKWWLYVVWILPQLKKKWLKKLVAFQLCLLSTFLSCAGLVREAWVPYPVLRHGLCICRLNPGSLLQGSSRPPT